MISRANQITKSFKQKVYYTDFDRNLSLNPITGQLTVLENAAAVINSVENLVLTYPTERFYHPEIGTNVSRSLFEPFRYAAEFSADLMKSQIVNLLASLEPRVTNVNVTTKSFEAQNYLQLIITFSIINIADQIFSLPIDLPIR